MTGTTKGFETGQDIKISLGQHVVDGILTIPLKAQGVVIFAHGSGSGRLSPRNFQVAQAFNRAGLGTLLFDLLTAPEEAEDAQSGAYRFDIELLADRLTGATKWLLQHLEAGPLNFGYFGASTGAAAALIAASTQPDVIKAVVSRGGRPDLAGEALTGVQAPTLLIVGGADQSVLTLNRQAASKLAAPNELLVIAGATHLFEEPGKLDEVSSAATAWFIEHLKRSTPQGHQSFN